MNTRVRGRPLDRNRPNRSALRAPQGYAPGQANDEKTTRTKTKKGDISNEVAKGTFLTRFDTPPR